MDPERIPMTDDLGKRIDDLIGKHQTRAAINRRDSDLDAVPGRVHPNPSPATDWIFASSEFSVVDARTLYADALTVGSDHALVIAELGSR